MRRGNGCPLLLCEGFFQNLLKSRQALGQLFCDLLPPLFVLNLPLAFTRSTFSDRIITFRIHHPQSTCATVKAVNVGVEILGCFMHPDGCNYFEAKPGAVVEFNRSTPDGVDVVQADRVRYGGTAGGPTHCVSRNSFRVRVHVLLSFFGCQADIKNGPPPFRVRVGGQGASVCQHRRSAFLRHLTQRTRNNPPSSYLFK